MPDYYATILYNGNASTTAFDFPNIPFISSADVEVFVSGTLQTITTDYKIQAGGSAVNGYQVVFNSAPASGTDNIKIRRKTSRSSLEVDFADGSTLTEADLDTATRQGIFLAEEALDASTDAITTAQALASAAATELPEVSDQAEWIMQVTAAGNAWEATSPANARNGLGLGTAAVLATGTGAGQLPTNGDLGTASLKAHGTAAGAVPLNSDLGNASLLTAGTSENNLVQADATGLPAIDASQVTNVLKSIPYSRAYYAIGVAEEHTYPIVSDTHYDRPFTAIEHGAVSTGITFAASEAPSDGTITAGATFTFTIGAGTWRTNWWCIFRSPNNVKTRFYDKTGTAVKVYGATTSSNDSTHSATNVGSGRFILTETSVCALQFISDGGNSTVGNLGETTDHGDSLNNWYAQIEFSKESADTS